jgi:hypothetical protein
MKMTSEGNAMESAGRLEAANGRTKFLVENTNAVIFLVGICFVDTLIWRGDTIC